MRTDDRKASWDLDAGTPVGDGHIAVRLLGGGERYEAWLGWDDELCTTVVLKVLRPDQVDDERARRAIAREAQMLQALAHPGIVRCFGAHVGGERPYLVLEFLDGPRLSTLIRRYGPLAPEQLVPLGLEIASALAYLHRMKRVHLDVKPQNLIMGAPPRLIDLSIARRMEEVPRLTRALGTDAYMAPEQCLPERLASIGPWSDVWGLGATLFEAANGSRPFRRRVGVEAHPQLDEPPAPFHPRVPAPLREIIASCLASVPSARPSLGEVMAAFDDLAPSARDEAVRRLRRRVR